MSHPHGVRGPGAPADSDPALHPDIRSAVPRTAILLQTGLAWVSTLATATTLIVLGTALDTLSAHRPLASQTFVAAITALLVSAAASGVGLWYAERTGADAERVIRQRLIARVFARGVLPAADRTGELLSAATVAVEKASHYRAAFLGPILAALTSPLLVIGLMALVVDPVTAGWLALVILLVPLLIAGFQRLVKPIGGAYRRTQGRLTAAFLQAIQAIETLVAARAAERVGAELARRGEEHRRGLMRLLAGNQLLILVVDAAFSLTVVVTAVLVAVPRLASGELSLGQGVAILLLTVLITGPVDVVGQFFYIGIAGRAAQRQLGGLLGVAPAAAPVPAEPHLAPESDAAILLESVTAGWPGAAPVLRGVDLRIVRGERVALVGPSGVGKSTLSALVQAHLAPRAGRVTVDGIDAAQNPEAVRGRLGVVEQRTFLFLGSIADNLRLAAPGARDEQLWHALDQAGLADEVRAMPEGIATPVGEHGTLLSGGQAQRLAIARAWLRDAPILILDEPTSQVDLASEAAILAALDRLAVGRTVLMIAHRPGAILAADRVVTLGAEPRGAESRDTAPGEAGS